jgi:hypothetical protein
MTATEQAPPEPPVGLDTVAAWRRRRRACEVPPQLLFRDDETPSNETRDTSGTADSRPRNTIGSRFNEAQRAGLAAMLSLAQAEPSAPSAPAAATGEPQPELHVSAPDFADDTSARLARVMAQPTVVERAARPVRPLRVVSFRSSGGGTHSSRQRRTVWVTPSMTRVPELPLLIILAMQVVLSLRLIWSNTAFSDEALYLWAGRLELAHWLHGTAVPDFPTYFSGAPVIYPPLGALADSVGGLATARILSLCFMLGATALLYAATSRLFSRTAAACAAAIFTVLGPVQVLSAFATYDAMAIFLIAFAVWLVTRAQGPTSEWFLIAAGLALALADAAKYSSALWTPVVLVLAALTSTQRGWARPALRGARLAAYTIVPLTIALSIGGRPYLRGIVFSTLNRQMGDTSAPTILSDSLKWVGIVLALAVVGTAISFMMPGRLRWICITLTVAGLLAPLHQAQIHVYTSLHKHVAFGAWFAAIVAGYALAKAAEVNEVKGWRVVGVVAGLTLFFSIPQATVMFYGWPDSFQMVGDIDGIIKSTGCPCLVAEQNVVNYYLPWTANDLLASSYGFSYWNPSEHREVQGIVAYKEAIRSHYFSVVEIDRAENPAIVQPVVQALAQTSGYRLVDLIPIPHWGRSSFEIWRWSGR